MIRRGSQVRVLSDPPFSDKFKLIVGLFFGISCSLISVYWVEQSAILLIEPLAELWPGSILQNFSENGFEISFVGFLPPGQTDNRIEKQVTKGTR